MQLWPEAHGHAEAAATEPAFPFLMPIGARGSGGRGEGREYWQAARKLKDTPGAPREVQRSRALFPPTSSQTTSREMDGGWVDSRMTDGRGTCTLLVLEGPGVGGAPRALEEQGWGVVRRVGCLGAPRAEVEPEEGSTERAVQPWGWAMGARARVRVL